MQGLNDSYSGGLSSYGLVLLVTSLLQLENQKEKQQDHTVKSSASPNVAAPVHIPDSIFTSKAALAVRASEFDDGNQAASDLQSSSKRRIDLGRLFISLLDTFGVRFQPQVSLITCLSRIFF